MIGEEVLDGRHIAELFERPLDGRVAWDDALVEQRVFERLAHLAPAMVIDACAGLMFPDQPGLFELARRVVMAYMIFVGAIVIDALLTSVVEIYRDYEIPKDRPIKN